jgi:hypothetical protein
VSVSLFGHLAWRFGPQPENLATEALNFILDRSPTARRALIKVSSRAGVELPHDLAFRTQVAGVDGSAPDLGGFDEGNAAPLLIEAKFWAGLTTHQPLSYLGRLPASRPAMLLFVAPAARLELLWGELVRRCSSSELELEREVITDEYWAAHVSAEHLLGLISWRALLGAIRLDVAAQGEHATAGDLEQLEGLCAQQDDEAFIPLSSDELTGNVGARVMQFCSLVNAVAERADRSGIVERSGLSTGGAAGEGEYARPYLARDPFLFASALEFCERDAVVGVSRRGVVDQISVVA